MQACAFEWEVAGRLRLFTHSPGSTWFGCGGSLTVCVSRPSPHEGMPSRIVWCGIRGDFACAPTARAVGACSDALAGCGLPRGLDLCGSVARWRAEEACLSLLGNNRHALQYLMHNLLLRRVALRVGQCSLAWSVGGKAKAGGGEGLRGRVGAWAIRREPVGEKAVLQGTSWVKRRSSSWGTAVGDKAKLDQWQAPWVNRRTRAGGLLWVERRSSSRPRRGG